MAKMRETLLKKMAYAASRQALKACPQDLNPAPYLDPASTIGAKIPTSRTCIDPFQGYFGVLPTPYTFTTDLVRQVSSQRDLAARGSALHRDRIWTPGFSGTPQKMLW